MSTASPAPATLFPLDEAWSDFPRRKAAVRTFIAGYCAARNRRDAPLRDSPDGHVVQFDGSMGRPFEHFVIEGAPVSGDGPFAVGAWITRYGAAPLPPALHGRTRRLSDEHFMAADIGMLSGDDALARALYGQLFLWIIGRINATMDSDAGTPRRFDCMLIAALINATKDSSPN